MIFFCYCHGHHEVLVNEQREKLHIRMKIVDNYYFHDICNYSPTIKTATHAQIAKESFFLVHTLHVRLDMVQGI